MRQLRSRSLILLKKRKDEDEMTDDDLLMINELMAEYGTNRASFALLLKRVGEKVGNPVFGALFDNYSPGLEQELREIERNLINDGVRLMVLNLLEDIDEDIYVEKMEILKEKLKIFRKLERILNLNDKTKDTTNDILAEISQSKERLSKNK